MKVNTLSRNDQQTQSFAQSQPSPWGHWWTSIGATVLALFILSCADGTLDGDHGDNGNNHDYSDDCEDGEVDQDQICVDGSWQDQVSPCATMDCGPNGSCVEIGDQGECDCDEDFEAQDDYCVSTGDDPCEGVDCGEQGVCVEQDGAPSCDCDEGSQADGLNCVDRPPCQAGDGCAVYRLPHGENAYEVTDFDESDLSEGLDGVVVAAFNLEETTRAYLLTESSYFRINTEDFSILDSGPHGDIHADLETNASLVGAFSIPERVGSSEMGEGNDSVVFVRNPDDSNHGLSLALHYNFSERSFEEFDEHQGWEPIDWSQDFEETKHPSVDDEYQAIWLDDENIRNFLQGDVAEVCGGSGPTDSEGLVYQAILTSTSVHIAAAAACFPFLSRLDNDTAPIFASFAHRPNPEEIGAAFWHDRSLYFFTTGELP